MVRPKQNVLKREPHVQQDVLKAMGLKVFLKVLRYHHLRNPILRVAVLYDDLNMDKTPGPEINDILHLFHKATKIKIRRSGASRTSDISFVYFMKRICLRRRKH